MKKRICILTSSFPLGKTDPSSAGGLSIRDFTLLLSKENLEIFVLAPGKPNTHNPYPFNVNYYSWLGYEDGLSSLNPKNPIAIFKLLIAIFSGISNTLKFVKKHDIDHCLAMWAVPSGLFALFAKFFYKTPYTVWALGSDIWDIKKYPFGMFFLKKVLKNAKQLFADGIKLTNAVEKISHKDCSFLASNRFLDKSSKNIPYSKFDPKKINFIFIGRYHHNKGIDLLIDAISLLNEQQKSLILFHIFGGGPLEKKIKKSVYEKNLSSLVFVNNWLDENLVYQYISNSDFIIVPSRIESIPVILSNAVQTKTPIILTNVGDMGELANQYNVGIIVEPTAHDIAQGIVTAINSPKSVLSGYNSGRLKLSEYLDLSRSVKTFINSLKH